MVFEICVDLHSKSLRFDLTKWAVSTIWLEVCDEMKININKINSENGNSSSLFTGKACAEASRQFHLFATWLNYEDVYLFYYHFVFTARCNLVSCWNCLALVPSWFAFKIHLKRDQVSFFTTLIMLMLILKENMFETRDLERIYREWKFCSGYYRCRCFRDKNTVPPKLSFAMDTNSFSYSRRRAQN